MYNNPDMMEESMDANVTINCGEIGYVANGIPITLISTMVPFTIYYDPDTGYCYEDENLTTQITKLSTIPTKTGYTFGGYPGITDSDGNIIVSTNEFSEPVTITATWTINTYNVNYNSGNLFFGLNDISTTTSTQMNYSISNGIVTVTSTNSDGYGYTTGRVYLNAGTTYTFNCTTSGTWGVGTEDTVEAFIMKDGIYAADLPHFRLVPGESFTATVSGVYWLRLDVNMSGKTHTFSNLSITSIIDTETIEYNTAIGTLPTVTNTGHSLIGWYTALNGTGTKVTDKTLVPANDVTYYADWTPNTYTVTLDNQSATTSGDTSITVTYGSFLPTTTKPTKSYTVSYNANSGNVTTTSSTATYTYGGYYTETSGNGTQYINTSGVGSRVWDIASDTILYAKWTSTSVTLPTPTRTGYNFNGWYTASSNGTKIGDAEDSYTPTENIILYAQWTGKTITITYNSNGGTGSMSNSTYKYGGSLSLPSNTFTKSCYNFTHWRVYRPADSKWYGCTDTSVTCSSAAGNTTLNWYSASEIKAYYQPQPGWSWATTSSTSNLTFYAQWSLAYNYSIANASGTITTCKNTLNESISAASTSYPIINTLRNASSDSTAATFNKNLTLNLNGHTITRTTGTITVNSGISVTVNGSGSITSTSGNVFQNNGVLYLNSGNYYSTEAVAIRNMGDLTINNSIVYSTGNNAVLWNGEDTSGSYNGRIWIENSTIYATHADAHTIRNWSNDTWPETATTGVAHNCDPHTCTIHITGKTKISQGHTSQSSKYTIISDRGTVHASGNFTGYIYAASNIALNSNTTNAIFKIYGGNIYSPNGSGHYYTPANASTSRIDINDGVRVKYTPTDWETLG